MSETKTSAAGNADPAKRGSNKAVLILVILLIVIFCCVGLIVGGFLVGRSLFSWGVDQAERAIRNSSNQNDENLGNLENQEEYQQDETYNYGEDEYNWGNTMPSGFPSDTPVISYKKISFSSKSKEQGVDKFSVTFFVSQNLSQIKSFYLKELPKNGWEIESEQSWFGYSIIAKKGSRELSVVYFGNEEGESMLTLTVDGQ